MAQKTYAGVTVDFNEEGYFTNPSQWTKEIALEIAKKRALSLPANILLLWNFSVTNFLQVKHYQSEVSTIPV